MIAACFAKELWKLDRWTVGVTVDMLDSTAECRVLAALFHDVGVISTRSLLELQRRLLPVGHIFKRA